MSNDRTRPSDATRDAEREEAKREHVADRPATGDEEREAELHAPDADVSKHEREMAERGAHQDGEGRLP
jgi:hypothetical protein